MSNGMSKATCALWYEITDGTTQVGLFETEAAAADFAVVLDTQGGGEPIGCEMPDGTTILVADWAEYADAVERFEEAQEAHENPPPSKRVVVNPFDGSPVVVDRKTPGWVGGGPQPGPMTEEVDPMFPITPL